MAGQKGRSGRRPKPTAQLKESGGFNVTRHRNRADVLVMPAKLDAPATLGKIGRDAWNRYIDNLPEALITQLDVYALQQLCEALELYAKVWPLFIDNPLDRDARITWQAVCAQIDRLGRQFGWTPQSRAALSLPSSESKEESMFGELIARMSPHSNLGDSAKCQR